MTTKKVATKKKAKKATTKKVSKKVTKSVDIYSKIMDEMKGFELEVLEAGTPDIEHEYIPFQNLAMNIITGGGAIKDRFLEISGDSQTGKSYLLYELMANVLNDGGHAYLNDNEVAYEKTYGDRSGILKGKKYLKSMEKDIHAVFREMRQFIKAVRKYDKKNHIVLGIDSYGGLSLQIDLDNEEAKKDPRGYINMHKANAWQDCMKNFVKYLDKYDATLVLVNQAKLDKQNATQYYKPYKSLGEDVVKFWATQRIQLICGKKIHKEIKRGGKKIKKIIGQEVHVTCIKNRTTAPFQKCTIHLLFEQGIRKYSGLDEILLDDGIITKGKKTVEGKSVTLYKLLSTGKNYRSIEKLVEANPEVASPKNHFSINKLGEVKPEEIIIEGEEQEDEE